MQPGAIPSKQTKDPAALPPRGAFPHRRRFRSDTHHRLIGGEYVGGGG